MRKLVVSTFAFAFAMVFSAFAGTQVNWFNGGIGADWPEDESMVGGEWSAKTATTAAELTAGYTAEKGIELDAGDDQLLFTADSSKTLGTGTDSVTVTSQLQLYPFAEAPATVEEGAKAGVILVTTDGGAYVYGIREKDSADPAANEWYKLSDTVVNPEDMATVTITAEKAQADGKLSVGYSVTVGSLAAIEASATVLGAATIEKASYTGSGFVKSLSSTAVSETKEFAVNSEELAKSYLQVVSVTGNGVTYDSVKGKYVVPYNESVTVTFGPINGYVAIKNNTKVYAYGDIADISAKPDDIDTPEKGKAYIQGGAYYLTLNAAVKAAVTGDTVVLVEDSTEAGFQTDSKNLTINLNKKVLTLNARYDAKTGKYAAIVDGGTATISDGKIVGTADVAGIIRAFGNLTLTDVEIDGSLIAKADGKDRTDVIRSISGVLTLNGKTKITASNKGAENYAVASWCHCDSYRATASKTRSLVIDLGSEGAINGDVLLAGESFTYVKGTIKGRFFGGAGFVDSGAWTDANDKSDPKFFAARVGALPTSVGTTTYEVNVTCELFPTLAGALSSSETAYGTVVTVLKDLAADVSVPASKTLAIGSYSVGEYKLTLAVGASVTSVAQIASTSFADVSGYTVKETAIKEGEETVGYSYALEKATYTITIVDPGSATASPATYQISDDSQSITLTAAPTKTDYNFNGYSLTAKDGVSLNDNVITITAKTVGDITVTANWTAAPTGFSVIITFAPATGITGYTVEIDGGTASEVYTADQTINNISASLQINPQLADWYKAQYNGKDGTGLYEAAAEVTLTAAATGSGDISGASTAADVAKVAGVSETTLNNLVPGGAEASLELKKAKMTKAMNWAKANSLGTSDIAALNFETPDQKTEAYLLGTAVDADAIKNAKAAFKFPSITPSSIPEVGGTANFNGTVTIKGSSDLKNWATAETSHKYYKAELTK